MNKHTTTGTVNRKCEMCSAIARYVVDIRATVEMKAELCTRHRNLMVSRFPQTTSVAINDKEQ